MSVCVSFGITWRLSSRATARRIETTGNGEGGDGHIRSPEKNVNRTSGQIRTDQNQSGEGSVLRRKQGDNALQVIPG
jgi:hypothetical protein